MKLQPFYFWLTFFLLISGAASALELRLPAGCDGVLTIQHKGCLAVNIWQCDTDPKGTRHIATFSGSGKISERIVDHDFAKTSVILFNPERTVTVNLPIADKASMDNLLSNGYDSFDSISQLGTSQWRSIGTARLTGNKITVDTEELLEVHVENETLKTSGEFIRRSLYTRYILEKDRVSILGKRFNPDGTVKLDNQPIEIIRPNETGFMNTRPLYGCKQDQTT